MKTAVALTCSLLMLIAGSAPLSAQDEVTFRDIAADGSAGIVYAHEQYAARWNARLNVLAGSQLEPISLAEIAGTPMFHPTGKSGAALVDYDNDGDLDIFATNVQDFPNSLFENQLMETGTLSFIDVAADVGIASPEHNASGTCYADIDNDGDSDIFVVGDDEAHRLYENRGGRFIEIASDSSDPEL